MDDAELIRRYIASDSDEAFAEIIARYRRLVFGVVVGVLGPDDSSSADDVVQEVFIKCASVLKTFRFESAFSTWLYRMAFNVSVDARRTSRSRQERDRRFSEELANRRPASSDEHLRDAVAELPDVYRFVVHAHYWLGHSSAEIAALLGVADATVRSYLFRARAMLARGMEKS